MPMKSGAGDDPFADADDDADETRQEDETVTKTADGETGPVPDVVDAPYGTSRTYSTPGGFEMADIDEANVRDGADREFYMPKELLEELDLTFDRLNLRYQTEVGRRLNKHPHWYNRLLVLGLAVIGDVDERDMDGLQELLDLPEPAED
jgi:hypothetical protein